MSADEKKEQKRVAQIELIDMKLQRPDTGVSWQPSGINWRIDEGGFWAIGGLHWSGKSNLLTTIAAINASSLGRLDLFGKNTEEMSEDELLSERLRIGMVFEGDGCLFPQLTVAENIALPLRYRTGRDDLELEERVESILNVLGLLEVGSNTPGVIDLGKRRRVGLARAVVLRPDILLFDQPLVGLSYRQQRWWRNLICELSRGHELMGGKPVTIVVTTENLRTWIDHARQFALLREGSFEAVGDREQMKACDNPLAHELLELEQIKN
ncbi:MAG: ATP-binding cassette domain-containing protein [Verrucomicrobiia bacterium]|jgi:phospholipid/cholesterol/gamma-HCH transport system ATP-binding protein